MTDVTARLRLVVDSSGLDKSGRKLKVLNRQARENEEAVRRMRAAYAALGAVVGGLFSAQVLQQYNEQARALAKVEQAIRSTAGAAGFSADELKRMAGELQGVTVFGDERILNEVTAQLLTFTNIANEEFARTQKVALDLATVLDGDLKSASIQLGKALNDPIANLSALSRSGIQFSESQREVIKSLTETGRLAEAQGVILDELERQYGGQARAAANVGTGLLAQLRNVVGDIQELMGERLFRAIGPTIRQVKEFLELDTTQSAINAGFNGLGKAIQGATAALVAYTTVQAAAFTATALRSVAGFAANFAAIAASTNLATAAAVVHIGVMRNVRNVWAGFTALVAANPIGFIATAIAATVAGLVAFRDELAQATFGISNAGAVIEATFLVIGRKTAGFRQGFGEAFGAIGSTISMRPSVSRDCHANTVCQVRKQFRTLSTT